VPETVSIWLRDEAPPSRPSPLTRARIVDEAVKLLDQHGVTGLTMRRLAAGLDVTATALYRHVRTKDDVLDLALDHIFGDVPLPEPGPDWRGDVRQLIRSWRSAMLRHPWSPSLIGRPGHGPNVLSRTEYLQSALVRGGFTGLSLTVTTRLLANYVIGSALTEATFHQSADAGRLGTGRWSDDELFDLGLDAVLAAAPGPAR
jgi:AcrR family transcriptional regulator